MILLKNARDLEAMRPACVVAQRVLSEVSDFIQPGVTTRQIDQFAAARMKFYAARSAFLGYRKYPCHVCISVNDEIVHGLAGERRVDFGDIISLDVGVIFNGFIGDTARTVPVGGCSVEAQRLMDVTERALYEGIAQAVPGKRVVDISRAIQKYVESNGFSVVREFVGHGVGRKVHEDPQIPNYGKPGKGPKIRKGYVLAIEPMINTGTHHTKTLNDGWTVVTVDGQPSAHVEHTIAITDEGPEVLTLVKEALSVDSRIAAA